MPTMNVSYTGVVLVTVAYFVLWYYLLIFVQRKAKYGLQARYAEEGKVFDRYFGQDEEMLAADRAVANTQEQMGPFLVSLWLFALLVSPQQATWLGGLYVALRSCYPLLLGRRLSKMQSKRVYFVTLPAYLIIFSMFGRVVWAVLSG